MNRTEASTALQGGCGIEAYAIFLEKSASQRLVENDRREEALMTLPIALHTT